MKKKKENLSQKNTSNNKKTQANLIVFILFIDEKWGSLFSLSDHAVIHTVNYRPNQFYKWLFPELMV